MQTIHEIASQILVADPTTGKVSRSSPSITTGLTPTKVTRKTGLVELTPQQILSVYVEKLELNGEVIGYQRMRTNTRHVRKIAKAIEQGKKIGPPELGLDGDKVYAVDGQHRLLAYVMARKPATVLITPMTERERADRFANQRYQRGISADNLSLAGDDPAARYLRDAIARDARGEMHPWASLVALTNSPTRMGPGVAYEILIRYSLSVMGGPGSQATKMDAARKRKFLAEHGDELAQLILTFGHKSTNPYAYKPSSLKAIADTAVVAVRRSENRGPEIRRWERHMPRFDWHAYAWATKTIDMRQVLIQHWNKRLSTDKKIHV